ILRQLVIANRILANEDVVDAYGHVSVRHPDHSDRYLLARSVAPELVQRGDIVEFALDGTPTGEEKRALYLERFIHGAIYEARPRLRGRRSLADRGGADVRLHAAQRPRAAGRPSARRRQAAVARRDRRPQRGLQAQLAGDSARLGILGAAGRLRRHARLAHSYRARRAPAPALLSLGSSTSRTASPSRLKPSTAM